MNEETLMDNEAYHADSSRIGKSGLDLIARSPAHYYARYLDPNREREEPTPALITGSAVHSCILEPSKFVDEYAVEPVVNKRTNKGKEELEEFYQAHAGKKFIDQSTYELCMRMQHSVMANPTAAALLEAGIAEKRYDFEDPHTGAPCKMKPDFISSSGVIVDLKTTEDASPHGFGKSTWNYRYHVQAAFYCDGYFQHFNRAAEGFLFIAVEKKPPYAIGLYAATNDIFDIGREAYIRDLETYMDCLMNNEWPAYGDKPQPLYLPGWALKKNY